MSLTINDNLTTVNFNSGSISRIKYIVVHYTANDGDTAVANTNYFKSVNRNASAHYFVDENSIWRCVADKDSAWHCGATTYKHAACRNSNSIGVEMCSRKDSSGEYYIKDEVVENAIQLVKQLMEAYGVPIDNVLRHYDVTGKLCPEPFVRETEQWKHFKERLITKPEPVPEYPLSTENLTAIQALGIINTPDYWSKVTSVQYLDTLLGNAVQAGICDKRIDNGITDIETALEVLTDARVINSPEYWQMVVSNNSKVEYLPALLINIANKCRIILEKIIHAEAQGEGLEGQLHVGNVIMNRDKSTPFPTGIYNIVFQPKQFSPVTDGAYARAQPSATVKAAVDKVLEQESDSQGATYFCSITESQREGNWHEQALTFLFEYGNHRFYK